MLTQHMTVCVRMHVHVWWHMQIPNEEMYWVVTTLVSETKSEVRAKFIKQFIKTASKKRSDRAVACYN